MESDLRSEGGPGPGPTFLHSTLTQHGTLRNSRTLYLNLAVHFVMKVCQYRGMEHILFNSLLV